MLDSLWHRVMEKRAQRLLIASKALEEGLVTTPWVEGKVEEARTWALANTVQISSPFEGRVVQPNGNIYLVNTTARTCSCRRYQENGIPCGHAMTLILAIGASITPYLLEELSAARWAATYASPLPPIDISGLAILEDEVCEPPVTRVPRGRPKKERVRREDVRRPRGRRLIRDHGGLLPLGAVVAAVPDSVRSRCSTCGEPGHNARRCRRPHQ
jgi:SWIM zinc finger